MATKVRLDNPHVKGNYGAWKAYNQSKLANYLFALGSQRRFKASGVDAMSLVAHPGLTDSDLQSTSQEHGGAGVLGWVFEKWAKRAA